MKITSFVGSVLSKYPRLLKLALNLRLKIWRLRVVLQSRRWADNPDVNNLYWVSPNKIEDALIFRKIGEYNKYKDRGKVIGGNWDRKRVKFTEFGARVLKGFDDRFIHGMSWEDTELYKFSLDCISKGFTIWNCRNKSELDARCKHLDYLFHTIKVNGYKCQKEISEQKGGIYRDEDEVTVRIGRDGVLLFEDGQHRLAIAKLLQLDKIPVKITVRHSKWYSFRREILDYAKANGGKIYQPITHPDLANIPSAYSDERFDLIRAHLPMSRGTILDIGASWGYFCHKFEEIGFDCYAIESDAQAKYFLEKLKIAEDRKFRVIYSSIFDYHDKNDFDVVLALNVFHHFTKTEGTFLKLIELLKRLNVKFMFFQAELPDSPQMQGAYRNFIPNEFVQFILDNSSLNEAIYIGQTDDRRPIYRLQRL
jgi:2-polyprenyl-3-methyl-5-hydroxy-6-metoxy-1,4-benzoquinol methylase